MTSKRKFPNAIERLESSWSHLAREWSKGNPEIAVITGEPVQMVRKWRERYVAEYHAAKGVLPPLSHVRMPGTSSRKRDLPSLDASHGHVSRDWSVTTSRIVDESGHHRASVQNWRRRHLAQWIAEGNEAPTCRCGKEYMHKGACGQVPTHVRQEAAARIIAGSDPDAIARRYRTDRATVLSWAVTTLPKDQRTAFKQEIRRRRSERTQRMRKLANRRKAGDESHRRILSLVRENNPEGEDAVQEAYLAVLEEGLSPEDAARVGNRRASRMAGIGWKPTSLDAPLVAGGETTRADLLQDDRPDQSSSLRNIDIDRMEGAAIPHTPAPARSLPIISHTRPTTNKPTTSSEQGNGPMQNSNHDDILKAVLAAHAATRRNMTTIAAESRIRNVDVCAILGGRKEPNEGQLARLADHFGIEHALVWHDRRPPGFQKGNAAKGVDARKAKKSTGRRNSAGDGAGRKMIPTSDGPVPTPVHSSVQVDVTPADDGALIDSVVAALLSAKNADVRLAEAKAALAAAELERDNQRNRADAAETRLAELENQLDLVRGIIAGTTKTAGRKIAA